MKESIIKDKSKEFALRIIKLYKYLTITAVNKEFVLSKQVLRSGTSIGLKEASETEYWLELLHESEYIGDDAFESIISDNIEIIKVLTKIVKNSE